MAPVVADNISTIADALSRGESGQEFAPMSVGQTGLGIPGLYYLPEFLSEEEANVLQESIDAGPAGSGFTALAKVGRLSSGGRPVVTGPGVHWHGFTGTVDGERCMDALPASDLPSLPIACQPALIRLRDLGLVPEGYCFDQVIVNNYPEGSKGIPSHVDR